MVFNNWQIRNISSWTMFIFGVLAFLLGVLGLIRPEITLTVLNFDVVERSARPDGDFTLMFIITSSMASVNMGIYYVLASLNDLKIFYTWTVPFRVVTFTVFTLAVVTGVAPTGLIGVAIWELVGAIATGSALFYESRSGTEL